MFPFSSKMVLCNSFLSFSPSITLDSASAKRLSNSFTSFCCPSNSVLVSIADIS
uniref:Uncharacterized protein n=1 Tax=Lotus japonicus TaxID=34305 RepID=I3S5T3_LOTJA|nr:unknown [Lotus japonicus]